MKIDKKYFNNFYIDKYLDIDTYQFNINNKKFFNIIYSDEVKIKKFVNITRKFLI